MEQEQVRAIGEGLLKQHGLYQKGWRIEFNRSPKYLGQCWFASKVIAISVIFLPKANESSLKETLLHEIAHALVGYEHSHNQIWREKAIEIGCAAIVPCTKMITETSRGENKVEVKERKHVSPLKLRCPRCGEILEVISRAKFGNKEFIRGKCGCLIEKEQFTESNYDNWVSLSGKIPYDYQKDGFRFIERAHGRCLIADEPALGKTVQAYSFLKFHEAEACPALWICKSTLGIQALKEGIDWCGHTFVPQIITSSKFYPLVGMKLYIVSYDLLRRIKREKLEALGIKTVIFDEVQHIKNPDSTRTSEVRYLVNNVDFFIALSGTPWKNRGSEYFSVLNMLRPDLFPSYKAFVDRWVEIYYDEKTGKYREGGIRNIAEFRKYTETFVLRRLRRDVLPDLPPINRSIRYVSLEDKYGEAYEKAEGKVAAIIRQLMIDGVQKNARQMQAEIMKLKHITGLAKVDAMVDDTIEFLEDREDWEKLTIFHHHIDVGDDLEEKLNNYLDANGYYPCLRLKGGEDTTKRNDTIEKFKNDPKARILIASTLASGEGLNIQFCQNAVMMERQWNPANEEQAELRFSRPLNYFEYPKYLQDSLFDEEHKPFKVSINVPYLTCANTVDEMLVHIVERKRVNYNKSMNPGDEELKFSEMDMIRELSEAIVKKRYGKAA